MLTLHLPKTKFKVEVLARRGRLLLRDASGRVEFALAAENLAEMLRQLADQIDAVASESARVFSQNRRASNWDWLTPKMVIEYFENSDVLRLHAADVRKVLQEQVSETDQLSEDIAAVMPHAHELIEDGKLVYGGQSKIARILGITNGGSHRARILAVADYLESSTSTSTTSTGRRSGSEEDFGPMAA